jgi:hypothetical protein
LLVEPKFVLTLNPLTNYVTANSRLVQTDNVTLKQNKKWIWIIFFFALKLFFLFYLTSNWSMLIFPIGTWNGQCQFGVFKDNFLVDKTHGHYICQQEINLHICFKKLNFNLLL